jgi:UTP:GlnB (protein PII) uridylyltransferase
MLRDAVTKLGKKSRLAFIYGSFARGEEAAASDVDLMLIGNVSTMEMAPVLRRMEQTVWPSNQSNDFYGRQFCRKSYPEEPFSTDSYAWKENHAEGN